jgi:hypothetical protein
MRFLRTTPLGDRSRSVVPHFHFVLIARESGLYLNTEEVRRRLVPFFPAPRQMMIRRLMPSQTKQEALEARVSYIFKKRTSRFLRTCTAGLRACAGLVSTGHVDVEIQSRHTDQITRLFKDPVWPRIKYPCNHCYQWNGATLMELACCPAIPRSHNAD